MIISNIRDLQTVVALDDDGRYLHVYQSKRKEYYKCPCCGNQLIPVAIDKDKLYKERSHFRHENGKSCAESYVHFMCKNAMFTPGNKIIVNNDVYIIKSIEIEKSLKAGELGIYKPDIILTTTTDKVFYVEVRNTNRKSYDYIPKWDALGNDVVEVDVRDFLTELYTGETPKISLLYSNGEYFGVKKENNNVNKLISTLKETRKETRQDIANLLADYERLDWFWIKLVEYKEKKITKEELFDSIKTLELDELGKAWDLVFNKVSCFKEVKSEIRDLINKIVRDYLIEYINNKKKKYKNILEINFEYNFHYIKLEYKMNETYALFGCVFNESIFYRYDTLIIHPKLIVDICNRFEEKEEKIFFYLSNFQEIKNYLYSNIYVHNYLMYLGDSDTIDNKFYNRQLWDIIEDYIDDLDKVKKEILNCCIDLICKKLSGDISILDIYEEINSIIDENMLRRCYANYHWNNYFNKYSYIDIDYYGETIIKIIQIDDNTIQINCNNDLHIIQIKNVIVNQTMSSIKKIISKIFDNLTINTTLFDIYADLSHYNNKHWTFIYDYSNNNLKLKCSYLLPNYIGNYPRTETRERIIEIEENVIYSFNTSEYRKTMNNFLNKTIAPIMREMLNELKTDYENTHIGSEICFKSEVKND